MKAASIFLAIAVCAVGCATGGVTAPASGPALAATIRNQMAAHDALPWSATRRLGWADFQGIPPSRGDESALTSYSLFHGVTCTGRSFEFRVVAAFLPRQSWVKPAIVANPTESARTLRHEQTHFDLSEVHEVVRQVDALPAGIVECRRGGIVHFARPEPPVEVEELPLAHGREGRDFARRSNATGQAGEQRQQGDAGAYSSSGHAADCIHRIHLCLSSS